MAQAVHGCAPDACGGEVLVDHVLDGPRPHASPKLALEDLVVQGVCRSHEQVTPKRRADLCVERHQAMTPAMPDAHTADAVGTYPSTGELDIRELKVRHLREAKPRLQDEL